MKGRRCRQVSAIRQTPQVFSLKKAYNHYTFFDADIKGPLALLVDDGQKVTDVVFSWPNPPPRFHVEPQAITG